jgi:hypothetical protein
VIADLGFAARLKNENDKLSVKVGTPGAYLVDPFIMHGDLTA